MAEWLSKLLGNRGEREAARHLRSQGFKIVARNARSRLGELDLIALDGECVVFVEVKTRTSHAAGNPVEAVTFAKQKKLTQIALAYLKQKKLLDHRARFDVVAVSWPEGTRKPEIQHYRNAFEPIGHGQMYS